MASASSILEGEETLWSIGAAATREKVGRWLYSSSQIIKIETIVTTSDDNSTLAECLTDNGVKMYGTERCSHCKNQKSLFGSDFAKITYIDCDEQKQICMDNGIQGYPTRKDSAGNFFAGVQSLEALAAIGGCQVD